MAKDNLIKELKQLTDYLVRKEDWFLNGKSPGRDVDELARDMNYSRCYQDARQKLIELFPKLDTYYSKIKRQIESERSSKK